LNIGARGFGFGICEFDNLANERALFATCDELTLVAEVKIWGRSLNKFVENKASAGSSVALSGFAIFAARELVRMPTNRPFMLTCTIQAFPCGQGSYATITQTAAFVLQLQLQTIKRRLCTLITFTCSPFKSILS